MPEQGFFADFCEADSTDPCRSSGKVLTHQIVIQSDRFKDLGSAITLDGGNAHLGENFEHPLFHGLAVIADCFFGTDSSRQTASQHFVETFIGEIGIYSTCPIADEQAEMGNLPGFSGFHNDRCLEPNTLSDQMMVDCSSGQK